MKRLSLLMLHLSLHFFALATNNVDARTDSQTKYLRKSNSILPKNQQDIHYDDSMQSTASKGLRGGGKVEGGKLHPTNK